MPLYDFRCTRCGERFEALAAGDERPACPACGADQPERVFTPFSGPFTGPGVRGAAARRSDAARKAREEQRQERFAKQRERREDR
jgi:putative FmdB family regulatory protein